MSAEHPEIEGQKGGEILNPHHFYAAYIFDQAETRKLDVSFLIEKAQQLGYPVRYWWLSEAMDLEGHPDRLIVCTHCPSAAEDAGMDLYEALKEQTTEHVVTWDDLEAAAMDECHLGKPIAEPVEIRWPDGTILFPEEPLKEESLLDLMNKAGAIFVITEEDVREAAREQLGQDLTEEEFYALLLKFKKGLEWIDWTPTLDHAIWAWQKERIEKGNNQVEDNLL